MSKLVTFEQAIELNKLGFDSDSFEFCFDIVGDWVEVDADSYNNGEYKLFYTSEALEWFREVKGIHCSVILDSYFDGSIRYTGRYLLDVYGGCVERETEYYYDNHSEAESALLDALIEYVSK